LALPGPYLIQDPETAFLPLNVITRTVNATVMIAAPVSSQVLVNQKCSSLGIFLLGAEHNVFIAKQ
jgi:hypothetical protein